MSLKVIPFLAAWTMPAAAFAGAAYDPPAYADGRTAAAPPALVSTVEALHAAALARDAAALNGAFAPAVSLVSGSIDIAYPRRREDAAAPATGDWLGRLAMNTGGDGDLPPDLTATQQADFLRGMEIDFVRYALEGEIAWGADPLVPGAICTYAQPGFDPEAVKAAGAVLSVEGTSFRAVRSAVPARAAPAAGATAIATLEPGRLYAVDYGPDFVDGWTPFHLPAGGTGWIEDGGDVAIQPLAQGLCFAGIEGRWLIVAQTAVGL
jgi:hypothetical protein